MTKRLRALAEFMVCEGTYKVMNDPQQPDGYKAGIEYGDYTLEEYQWVEEWIDRKLGLGVYWK